MFKAASPLIQCFRRLYGKTTLWISQLDCHGFVAASTRAIVQSKRRNQLRLISYDARGHGLGPAKGQQGNSVQGRGRSELNKDRTLTLRMTGTVANSYNTRI